MSTNNKYNPAIHHRQSIRLAGWDYSSTGYYFITVCAHNRTCLFGHIDDDKMCLNEFGTIVRDEWYKSFVIRRELSPDEFVVMPNHFHGIVRLVNIPINAQGSNKRSHNCTNAPPSNCTNAPPSNCTNAHPSDCTNAHKSNRTDAHPSDYTDARPSDCRDARPCVRTGNGIAYHCPKSISSFMAGVKSIIAKKINEIRKTPGAYVLQSRFHDHIIRDANELYRIRQYIQKNPFNWKRDSLIDNTDNTLREPFLPYGKEPWMI